jgi:hypothetical protein
VTHAWFVGVVDGVGFAVLVEGGGSGGQVAGPIAARFVEELERLRSGEVDPADPASAGPTFAPPEDDADADGDPDDDGPTVQPDDG